MPSEYITFAIYHLVRISPCVPLNIFLILSSPSHTNKSKCQKYSCWLRSGFLQEKSSSQRPNLVDLLVHLNKPEPDIYIFILYLFCSHTVTHLYSQQQERRALRISGNDRLRLERVKTERQRVAQSARTDTPTNSMKKEQYVHNQQIYLHWFFPFEHSHFRSFWTSFPASECPSFDFGFRISSWTSSLRSTVKFHTHTSKLIQCKTDEL